MTPFGAQRVSHVVCGALTRLAVAPLPFVMLWRPAYSAGYRAGIREARRTTLEALVAAGCYVPGLAPLPTPHNAPGATA